MPRSHQRSICRSALSVITQELRDAFPPHLKKCLYGLVGKGGIICCQHGGGGGEDIALSQSSCDTGKGLGEDGAVAVAG